MARIRSIKPDFFISDTVSALPLRARLTWIGLWTHCDDHGRCRDNVKLVKAAVWPLDDVSLRDVASDLTDLERAGVIFRYEVEGKSYIQVTNWAEHQKVDRPSKSTIPPPPGSPENPREDASTLREAPSNTRGSLASPREDASRARDGGEGKGTGKGGEGTRARAAPPEPPSRCRQHLHIPDPPPCGACGDARRAHERWQRDAPARLDDAPACPQHRGQPLHNCRPCRSEELEAGHKPWPEGPVVVGAVLDQNRSDKDGPPWM